MRQALHVLRKDIRCLWPEILIALVAAAGFAYGVSRGADSFADQTTQGMAATLLIYLLPVTWWALIARLIHNEPLAGGDTFWVSRPYRRAGLLASKLIFIALFINLPKLVADVIILRSYGFRISQEAAGLLWHQVLLTAIIILPAIALSAITSGFAQLIAAAFVIGLTIAGVDLALVETGHGAPWLAFEWARDYCIGSLIAIASAIIIIRQFARRSTFHSQLAAGGTVLLAFLVLVLLPWPMAFALQSGVSRGTSALPAIHVVCDRKVKPGGLTVARRDDGATLQIPLQIAGIPAGMKLVPEGIDAAIRWAGGDLWPAKKKEPSRNVQSIDDRIILSARVDSSLYSRIKTRPIRVTGTAYLTLYGNRRGVSFPVRKQVNFVRVPGAGLCSATKMGQTTVLICRSALRSHPDRVTFNIIGQPRSVIGALPMVFYTLTRPQRGTYSPFPAEIDLVPVTQSIDVAAVHEQARSVATEALEPVAHIRKDFDFGIERLTDYEVAR